MPYSRVLGENEEQEEGEESVMDRLRRRNRPSQRQPDWSTSGSFINKPQRGWLHPDEQLAPNAGVCYGVRYIGCMEVKQSMKTLDFDTRTAIAKESISRVCDAAGLKTAAKKASKRGGKISKYLGEDPSLAFAGSNVNLTITTESITLMIMESGEYIANHQMPGISFASGGDPDTMDFVAYVAKDPINGRACFVLECGGGLAQDVITTVGQAFELRFKQYINSRPEAVNTPDRTEMACGDAWGDDNDYYNDRPGAKPPSPTAGELPPDYASPASNQEKDGNLIDFGDSYDNRSRPDPYDNGSAAMGGLPAGLFYENPGHRDNVMDPKFDDAIYDNKGGAQQGVAGAGGANQTNGLDAFDMKPFTSALPASQNQANDQGNSTTPSQEEWFHGQLSRQQAEDLLLKDGDFLVRESANSPGQYVLSGMHSGRIKHLLLVDPKGVVRTKDRTFTSVSHLIHYHMENSLPIISQDSELVLKNPIIHTSC